MDDLVGRTLKGRYRFEDSAGRGGMASVYKVWDHQRAVHLAAKVLRTDLSKDHHLVQRFQQEAAVLEELRHPHIVRFYGLECAGPTAFILMEYIEGQSLRDTLRARGEPLSGSEVVHYLRPIVAALHYAHQQQIFHCDVKASNVLVDRTSRVYLGDFGIARIVQSASDEDRRLGTPTHMAPEQCRGGPIDARTDVYGLGVTLYEMVTGGHVPFTGDTKSTTGTRTERIQFQHINQPPPPLRQVNQGLPGPVERVILRALAKAPAARYPSVMTLFEALETAYQVDERAGRRARPRPEPDQAVLVVREGESAGHVLPIRRGSLRIGRSRYNDVRLRQTSVSRRHAVIRWAQGRFWLQDEGSLHGTYLNGRRVQARRLSDGDLIQIEDTVFEFRLQPPEPE